LSPLPQALALLIEFAKLRLRPEPVESAGYFFVCQTAVTSGLAAAPDQTFFIPTGGAIERASSSHSETLKTYSRWGFLDDEWIGRQKSNEPTRATLMSRGARQERLRQLLEAGREITINDFMSACEGQVHRRTAERDLQESPLLKASGSTRGRTYKKHSKK
jgi:hypothetical protein